MQEKATSKNNFVKLTRYMATKNAGPGEKLDRNNVNYSPFSDRGINLNNALVFKYIPIIYRVAPIVQYYLHRAQVDTMCIRLGRFGKE